MAIDKNYFILTNFTIDGLKSLKTLNLQHNRILEIPESIVILPLLKSYFFNCIFPQQFLNFFLLPQGQGLFRPILKGFPTFDGMDTLSE